MTAGGVCGECLREPPLVRAVFGPMRYREPLRLLVSRAKFHSDLACAAALGEILGAALVRGGGGDWADIDALVPVPLGKGRLKERGYNQAVEIAAVVARRVGRPMIRDGAARVRDTPRQSQTIGRVARERNLREAFVAVPERVAGLRVAVVDDVVTTGATVYNLARALYRAGAAEVTVWCCARAEPPHPPPD